jgi:hypothetical protein
MDQYYKATVKVQYEDKKGNVKFKREAYIVSAISPTEVEAKIAKELSTGDYEIVGINVTNIVDVIK